jgi:hypothetical protein
VKLVALGIQGNDIQSVFLRSYQEITPFGHLRAVVSGSNVAPMSSLQH